MNTRLAIVFAGFIAASPVSASDPASTARVGLDASKLRLASANVLVLDATPGERIAVDIGDLDLLKGSHSRLNLGSELSRGEMLQVALMASENRAASSLARHYPGGTAAAVEAMNRKAQSLGMTHTHFSDPTG